MKGVANEQSIPREYISGRDSIEHVAGFAEVICFGIEGDKL